jgi:hypothetical protein
MDPSAAWHKSTTSNSSSWVEVAFVDGRVALRNSKDPDGPVLVFTPFEWEAFVGGVRLGEFELSPLARASHEAGSPQPS